MLEQRRLDYLQAMGITQWMPRKPLANAPEPRWWPHEVAAVDTTEELIQAVVATIATEPSVPTKPKLELVKNTPPVSVEPQPVPEFTLYFNTCQLPVVWICSNPNELPALQRFVFALQRSLLGQSYHLPTFVEFKWPFLQSSSEDQSQAVALQALKAQWQVFAQQQPLHAICLDSTSQHWLAQAEINSLIQFPSLSELLSSAELKRALWLALVNLNIQR